MVVYFIKQVNMEFITSFVIAIGLAMDAFAVSLGVGTTGRYDDLRSNFRLSFHFGLFQGGMTILGWVAGSSIAKYISDFDHWIALILLAYVGIKMIRSGLDHSKSSFPQNPSKGKLLIILCVATSIDALAVGLSFAMLKSDAWWPSLLIGIVTLGLSFIGLKSGQKLGVKFGKQMEVLGGSILIIIGLRILISHLFV